MQLHAGRAAAVGAITYRIQDMPWDTMTLDEHFSELQARGFTVFKHFVNRETVDRLRRQADPYFDELIQKKLPGKGGFWQAAKVAGRGRVALAPALGPELESIGILPTLVGMFEDSFMLDFADMVLGPACQLDSYELTGYPRRGDPSNRGTLTGGPVYGWHRDPFAISTNYSAHNRLVSGETRLFAAHSSMNSTPTPPYRKPLACNCLVYLQDMNDTTGQFRIARDSHLDASPVPEALDRPLPNEELVSAEAGDLICELTHTLAWAVADQMCFERFQGVFQ